MTVPEQRPGSSGEAPRSLSLLPDDAEVSRLRFELAIDAARIGSFDWDLVTGRLSWDEQLLALFGYTEADFDETLDAFAARLHPDDRDRTLQALQDAVDTRGAYEAEFRVVLPSGDIRWVQGRGRALADSRGRPVRLLGAALDTTRLREGDARVSRVLETMRSAFFALDRSWRFTYVNAEAERVLHRTRDELLGGVVWELFPDAVGSAFETHYRAAMEGTQERVFEAYYPPPLDAWYEVRAWPGPDGLSVYFLDVTERRAVEERARAGAARLALIAEVSALMSSALGSAAAERAALQRVAEAVVPVLGDWAILTLADGTDGRTQDVASWHADPAMRAATATYAALRLASVAPDAPVLRALESGRLFTVADVPAVIRPTLPEGEVRDVFDALAPRTAVTLPLLARGRTLGALSVYRGADRSPAAAEDVAAAREVADRVALALDNARLFDQQRRLAEALQRSMLTAPPQPDDAEIVVRYQPAVQVAQVGGDWYDAFLQPDGSTVLVIGDVVGHDIEAAAAMGQLRGMLRGIAHRGDTPPDAVLAELDSAVDALGLGTMATAVVARVEQTPEQRAAGTTTLRWSNAGHPPPLLLTPEGEVRTLGDDRGELMLGVDPAARRTSRAVEVRRGSTLLLYTDGLVEGRDLLLDEGTSLLGAALAQLADLPLERLCDALVTRLRPEGLQDDVALVAIRLHPQ
ncbi:SpoIIE family protein phosphatase [Geodermatophilus obscurus]|uniref:SpoIIE family protein phosphatase n=1 Tax=Geodermatophilus obscurus TaxID=1861 RepID=UPI001FCBB2F7|nr:SpoIIE family protein phosphatase [Geodermatophilus obscurus]